MSQLTTQALLAAYAAYGPKLVFANQHREDWQCATCGLGCTFPGGEYLLENGIRHTVTCPIPQLERALDSEDFTLRCMHPETLRSGASRVPTMVPAASALDNQSPLPPTLDCS